MTFLDENPYVEPGDWRLSDASLRLRPANRDALDVEAFIALARELSRAPSVLDELAALEIPTTIIVGRRDSMRRASKSLARAMPHAALHQIRRAYHFPQLSHPNRWRDLVEAHLADVATRP
ncbi:MAG: alpha/beta fold hydrolase, partial [Acidimicrobiales bacterium]